MEGFLELLSEVLDLLMLNAPRLTLPTYVFLFFSCKRFLSKTIVKALKAIIILLIIYVFLMYFKIDVKEYLSLS